jgi:predicted anti-sigma-YlaC factor YlaD
MLDCRQVQDRLLDLLDGAVPGPGRAVLLDHLRTCDGCLDHAGRVQATWRLVADTAVVSLSPAAREAVLDAYRRRAAGRPVRR